MAYIHTHLHCHSQHIAHVAIAEMPTHTHTHARTHRRTCVLRNVIVAFLCFPTTRPPSANRSRHGSAWCPAITRRCRRLSGESFAQQTRTPREGTRLPVWKPRCPRERGKAAQQTKNRNAIKSDFWTRAPLMDLQMPVQIEPANALARGACGLVAMSGLFQRAGREWGWIHLYPLSGLTLPEWLPPTANAMGMRSDEPDDERSRPGRKVTKAIGVRHSCRSRTVSGRAK